MTSMPIHAGWRRLAVFGFLLAIGTLPAARPAAAASPEGPPIVESPAQAGVGLAWQIHLPLRSVDAVGAIHLTDTYLLVLRTDGLARSVRADTGELAWSRWVAQEGDTVWGPISCRHEGVEALALTRLNDVLFLERETGHLISRIDLPTATAGRVAVADELLFSHGVDRRLRGYHVEGRFVRWIVQAPAPLRLDPLYLAREDVLYFCDDSGQVAAATGARKTRVFSVQVEGTPLGRLALSGDSLYLATSKQRIYALDRRTGRPIWSRRLTRRLAGGPIVTHTGLYQAVQDGGIQRIDLTPEGSATWYVPGCRKFLAEWPGRTVLLRDDGRVVLVQTDSGQVTAVLDLGGATHAVSNTLNDAVVLCSADGGLRCYRPLGAKPLTPADFRPAPEEAPGAPSSRPADPGAEGGTAPAPEGGAGAPLAENTPPPERREDVLKRDPLRAP